MTIRSFFAVPLPGEIIREFDKMIRFLKLETEGVKWVSPKSIHLTLKFLGNLTLAERDKVIRQLDQFFLMPKPAFQLKVSGNGVFPNPRNPRVFWVGVQGTEMSKLMDLQSGIENELAIIGFEKEKRKYSPHLTIGRAKQIKNVKKLMQIFEAYKFPEMNFKANEVHLMKSELRPQGAQYSIQKSYEME